MNTWQNVTINDLGQIITGSTPPTKKTEYYGNEYPFITPTDIEIDSRIVHTERFLSQKGYEYNKKRLLPRNAVCVVCIASIGKICMTSVPSVTNQQINSVVANQQKYDPYFVYYLLRTQTDILQNVASGVATPIVNKTSFAKLKVCVPPLPTQRKIAAILSTNDDLIENNTRRIKILEDMAQTLYREWFVHYRFPEHENVQMVESKLGQIPQGWEVKQLADLVLTQYGYTESATEDEVGPKFVRGKDINKTTYIDWGAVPFCPIDAKKHAKYQLDVGDILVIRMADPGKVAIIEKDINAVFASYLIRLKLRSTFLSPYYLFYALLDARYQNYVDGASTGTTRKSASAGVITDFGLVIPTQDVRKSFEELITSLRKSLNNLLEKNANLRQTRDLLLPKLISGEIDVSELDINKDNII